MKSFLQPMESLVDIQELRKALKEEKKIYDLSGCSDAEKSHVIYGVGHDTDFKLVVTFDELRAKALYEEYSFFEPDTVYYPGKDLLFYQSDIRGNALSTLRLQALKTILTEKKVTLITTVDALMNKLPAKEMFAGGVVHLDADSTVDLEELQKQLIALGYERTSQVEQPGEFAVRGGIIDVYSLTEENPFRIELWGDEIDSMRTFNVTNQKSIDTIDAVDIYPAMELVLDPKMMEDGIQRIREDEKALYERFRKEMKTEEAYHLKSQTEEIIEQLESGWIRQELETHLLYFVEETHSLLDYFPEDTIVFLDELSHMDEKAKTVSMEFQDSMSRRLEQGYLLPKQLEMLFTVEELKVKLQKFATVLLSTLDTRDNILKIERRYHIRAIQGTSYNSSFPLLVKELKKYKKNKYRMILVSPSRTRAKRLAEDLQDNELNSFYTEDFDKEIYPGEIMVVAGNIKHGFEYPDALFVVISESDIFGQVRKKKRKKPKYEGEKIASFQDLHVGDYVVHENHGLGIYRGLEKIEVDHIMKDYIKIEYAKGGSLYILASQLNVIQKYGGSDGKKPKLNTLGSQEWAKTKARVQSAVGLIAKELVELYALRQKNTGYVYGQDTTWQREFEEAFPYEETESQLLAIEDIKRDMESPKIMDRLICGDVGYGKTEIAMRAAFKAVQEGKQVVYLVPTTILAEQHYNNFLQRMKDYPVNIGLLCRFVSEKDQKKTIARLAKGEVDIVIGTHRVLSKDVKYKDLGLLIIDEEQRFGVDHKEKIKQLKKNIDVLSLSATPIPRTLHMSMIGIRDMSVLEEAPMDRMPIQTFVFEMNEEMIREAIVREMARGGQVYYVINRVRSIGDVAAKIQNLVPEASVAYIHGKMNETQIENVMYDFVNKDIDVLVATTIIEIGMDISNVNTIIIHDADQLGLSQLYQLRGRVGRSNRTAYAFLMYQRNKMLKEVAEKRLAAIREFTDLGSGFKIAMRDLEIRGAGNMLGREQHGHMAAVGYDLYCKMLNEAVLTEKGEKLEMSFDTEIDIDIDAYIPPTYISDEAQKLDIYKRIAGIENEDERDEMLEELIDRFGEPPKSVQNLLLIALIRIEAHRAYVTKIVQRHDRIIFTMLPQAKINPDQIPMILDRYKPYLSFAADKEPYFTFAFRKDNRLNLRKLPEYMRDLVQDIYEFAVEKG